MRRYNWKTIDPCPSTGEVELAGITYSDIVALLNGRRLKFDACGGISDTRERDRAGVSRDSPNLISSRRMRSSSRYILRNDSIDYLHFVCFDSRPEFQLSRSIIGRLLIIIQLIVDAFSLEIYDAWISRCRMFIESTTALSHQTFLIKYKRPTLSSGHCEKIPPIFNKTFISEIFMDTRLVSEAIRRCRFPTGKKAYFIDRTRSRVSTSNRIRAV